MKICVSSLMEVDNAYFINFSSTAEIHSCFSCRNESKGENWFLCVAKTDELHSEDNGRNTIADYFILRQA